MVASCWCISGSDCSGCMPTWGAFGHYQDNGSLECVVVVGHTVMVHGLLSRVTSGSVV